MSEAYELDLVPAVPAARAAYDIEAVYLEYRPLLVWLGSRKFWLPETEIDDIIQEVMLSFLVRQREEVIRDIKAWLVAAMCNGCRRYWRKKKQLRECAAGFDADAFDDWRRSRVMHRWLKEFEVEAMQERLSRAIPRLTRRQQELVFLHYVEGRAASEIAVRFGISTRYAEKLIHSTLKKLRELLGLPERTVPRLVV